MGDQSFRGHIRNLEQQGELVRVDAETDVRQNVSTIGWKTYDRFGKSTLFTNLKGFPGWRLASQVVTDRRKWAIGLGVAEKDLIRTVNDRFRRPLARRRR